MSNILRIGSISECNLARQKKAVLQCRADTNKHHDTSILLALLDFCQQCYCRGAGVRHPSSVRPSTVDCGFSEITVWIQVNFMDSSLSTISPDFFFFFFQNFQFSNVYIFSFLLTWDPIGAKISKKILLLKFSYDLRQTS